MESTYSSNFVVQFWGVRGSIPVPGKQTVGYGGNTSCVEMRINGKRMIFDAGTGIQVLGQHMMKDLPQEAYLFFTHYHWDHIQGFPMFLPAFTEGNRFYIYGAVPRDAESMKQHFIDRILHPNSPVPIDRMMRADIEFRDVECGSSFSVEDVDIETGPLNHPNGAMGYRITWQGHSVFYCTDTEHFADKMDESVLYMARDADMLIYDAMYTDAEYNNPKSPKVGWGHSTWQEAVKVAKVAGVKRLVIFHHEPTHSDEFLDNLAIEVREAYPNSVLAKEGAILQVA